MHCVLLLVDLCPTTGLSQTFFHLHCAKGGVASLCLHFGLRHFAGPRCLTGHGLSSYFSLNCQMSTWNAGPMPWRTCSWNMQCAAGMLYQARWWSEIAIWRWTWHINGSTSTVKCWKNRIIEASLGAGCFTFFGVDVSKGTNKNTKTQTLQIKGWLNKSPMKRFQLCWQMIDRSSKTFVKVNTWIWACQGGQWVTQRLWLWLAM